MLSALNMSANRNCYVDYLKAFLMLSVIMGHTATALSAGALDGLPEPWRTIPYAGRLFDMPLFMAISGYFFYSSCSRREFKDILYSRVSMVLLPCVVWCWIQQIIDFLRHPYALSWVPGGLWFLWALLACSLLTGVLHYAFGKKCWLGALFVMGVSLMVKSDPYNIAYVFPFFFGGYAVARYSLLSLMRNWIGAAACCLLILGYAVHFSGILPGYSVWRSHSYLFGPLGVEAHALRIAFRLYLGAVGCIAFPWLLYRVYAWFRRGNCRFPVCCKKLLSDLGMYSLSFYCIQSIVVEYCLKNGMFYCSHRFSLPAPGDYACLFSCVCVPFCCVAMILCCRVVLWVIFRNVRCRVILCGK